MQTFDPVAYINTPRWQHMDLGLDRIEELLGKLGRPQDRLRFVHVAGTNGKGSVCAYIASALQASGYRTGLFTSPYIEHFEERIRVDGRDIPPGALLDITLEVRDAAESMDSHPTEFELMCAVAMMHFARCDCNIVVLEVGLGGRFDATNVINRPEACVICRLGIDHTNILGSTIEEIAAEKAGIIKHGCPVISWPQEPAAMSVLEDACARQRAMLHTVDFSKLSIDQLRIDPALHGTLPMRTFAYRAQPFSTQLLGNYQPANAALAIEALLTLKDAGWTIPRSALVQGIADTRWPGRFEICGTSPLFIVDGGHNPQGAHVMADTMRELLPGIRPVFLIGILADKDYPAMLREVAPLGSAFVCVAPRNPRALPAKDLAEALRETIASLQPSISKPSAPEAPMPPIATADSFESAVEESIRIAGPEGAVCAFGSLYSIADIKSALRQTAPR